MSEEALQTQRHPRGKHRYHSVVDGIELANDYERSRLPISEFARQRGVSFRMVKYWSTRARRLATSSSSDFVQVGAVTAPMAVPQTAADRPALPALPAPITLSPTAEPVAGPPTIEVRLPNGIRVAIGPGFSSEVLTQVIACLGRGGSC